MKRVLIVLAAVVIAFLAGLILRPKTAAAGPVPQAQNGCAVPKSWGTFRGGVDNSVLLFEDSSGTIRWFNYLNSFTGTTCSAVTRQ